MRCTRLVSTILLPFPHYHPKAHNDFDVQAPQATLRQKSGFVCFSVVLIYTLSIAVHLSASLTTVLMWLSIIFGIGATANVFVASVRFSKDDLVQLDV